MNACLNRYHNPALMSAIETMIRLSHNPLSQLFILVNETALDICRFVDMFEIRICCGTQARFGILCREALCSYGKVLCLVWVVEGCCYFFLRLSIKAFVPDHPPIQYCETETFTPNESPHNTVTIKV